MSPLPWLGPSQSRCCWWLPRRNAIDTILTMNGLRIPGAGYRRIGPAAVALALGACCHSSGCTPTSTAAGPNPEASTSASRPTGKVMLVSGPASAPSAGSSALPPVERACTRDSDCAVARIEVAGAQACCPSCGTTPGTRRWHAALQRSCGARDAGACYPLACPQGPTRAVCRSGFCEATELGPDGGPARVIVERRCLPVMICDGWAGCAMVSGNAQDGWFVEESDRAARGETVALGNVCTTPSQPCEAARILPVDSGCAPRTVPPLISAPGYGCGRSEGHCRTTTR